MSRRAAPARPGRRVAAAPVVPDAEVRAALRHASLQDLKGTSVLIQRLQVAALYATGESVEDISSALDLAVPQVVEHIQVEFARLWALERERVS